jgi:hypothetical protein
MTPYLMAKKGCAVIKKKNTPNTFQNIVGGDPGYLKNQQRNF